MFLSLKGDCALARLSLHLSKNHMWDTNVTETKSMIIRTITLTHKNELLLSLSLEVLKGDKQHLIH